MVCDASRALDNSSLRRRKCPQVIERRERTSIELAGGLQTGVRQLREIVRVHFSLSFSRMDRELLPFYLYLSLSFLK
jgi:hypothetical protein